MENLIYSQLKEVVETNNATLSLVNALIDLMKQHLSEESSQNPKVISYIEGFCKNIRSAIDDNNKLLGLRLVYLESQIADTIHNIRTMIEDAKINYECGISKNKINKIGCDIICGIIIYAAKLKNNIDITVQKSDLNNAKIFISTDKEDFDSVSELERLKLRDIGGTIEIIKRDKGNSFEITLPILQSKDVRTTQKTEAKSDIGIKGDVGGSVIIQGDGNTVQLSMNE
jgi:hypothetical protein